MDEENIVEEITDPEVVEKLLGAQTHEEFVMYYEEYMGQELDYVPLGDEGRQDKAIWYHLAELVRKAQGDTFTSGYTLPEGGEVTITEYYQPHLRTDKE